MKGFSTILLGFVLIKLLISFVLMAFVMFKMSVAPGPEKDGSGKLKSPGIPANKFWTDNKALMIIPTVSNILCMILLGVLLVTN